MKRPRSPKAARSTCDWYWRRLVKVKGYCESCGCVICDLEAAHIVRRSWAHTRTDLANGLCLCRDCHRKFDTSDVFRTLLVARTIGMDGLDALEQKARAGVGQKFDWFAERERLRLLHKERVA